MPVLEGEEDRHLRIGSPPAGDVYDGLIQSIAVLLDLIDINVLYGVVRHFSITYILVEIIFPGAPRRLLKYPLKIRRGRMLEPIFTRIEGQCPIHGFVADLPFDVQKNEFA